MDGAIQVLPNQGVMFNILDEVLLGDVAHGEVLDSVDRDDADVFDGPQEVLEGDEVAPNARLVGRLDLVVEVVQDYIVDEFIPGQNRGDFIELALSNLHPTKATTRLFGSRRLNQLIHFFWYCSTYLNTSCWIWNFSLDLKTAVSSNPVVSYN